MRFNKDKLLTSVTISTVVVGSMMLAPVAQAASRNDGRVPSSPSTNVRHPHVAFSIRLEDQMLAVLRYLPVTFQVASRATPPPTTTTTSTTTTLPTASTTTSTSSTTSTTSPTATTTAPTTTTTVHIASKPSASSPTKLQPGTFKWRFGSLPAAFRRQWSVGTENVILRGALMRFQSVNNLATTGATDPTTWQRLVSAAIQHRLNPTPYNLVVVQKASPESLRLYTNGTIAFRSLVNTGISVMPTANGTFPVYLRYTSQTMSGTNPNGTHYNDPGIPWVSYFNGGDALHGFIRSTYGWPQSLGCVEMPFAQAKVLWPHTPIGTMVTVD